MSIVALSYHVFHAKTSRHVSYLRKGKNVPRLDALPVTKYNVCAGARTAACAGACFLQIQNWKIVKVAPFGARQNMVSSNQKTGRAETIPTVFAPRALLLCKQAAKNFHTICKKETALKRVLSNLLSAVSLLRFKAVFSCGFRVPPGSGLYQSCAAGSVCIPAGQKYCSPRPRKSCPADRKTLGLPSRCIGHRW